MVCDDAHVNRAVRYFWRHIRPDSPRPYRGTAASQSADPTGRDFFSSRARVPHHRPPPSASAAQRLRMVQIAVADEAGFYCDDRELRRRPPSYMSETIHAFRQERPDDMPCLIVGLDAALTLERWHQWRQVNRAGAPAGDAAPALATAPIRCPTGGAAGRLSCRCGRTRRPAFCYWRFSPMPCPPPPSADALRRLKTPPMMCRRASGNTICASRLYQSG